MILLLYSEFVRAEISGTVIDSLSGKGIASATVSVKNSYIRTTTNAKGEFSLNYQQPGTVLLISHLSYQSREMTVSGDSLILLKPAVYLSEEFTVTASRMEENYGGAYSELNSEEIQKRNLAPDIPYLLSSMPSTVATSDAGAGVGYTGLRIRGSDATRINVTINGVAVNEAESHQVYWVDLPDLASSVENIQVQRGLGASTIGAGSFGGSINILTDKLSSEPFGNVSSSAGSFSTFKNTVRFGTGLSESGLALEGRLSKINSDGYIERSSADLQSFFLTGGYYGKKNSLRALIMSGKEVTQQAWYGVPEKMLEFNRRYNPAGEYTDEAGALQHYSTQVDNYGQDYYQLIFTHEFSSQLFSTVTMHYTRGGGYFEEYKEDESPANYNLPDLIIGDSVISAIDVIRRKWLVTDYYGCTFITNYSGEKWKLTAGGSVTGYHGRHFGEVIAAEVLPLHPSPFPYYNDAAGKSEYNFYVKAIYPLTPALNIFADVQERIINYSFIGFDENLLNVPASVNLNFINPKAGFNFSISEKWNAYLFAGRGKKEPVRDDYVYSTPLTRPEPEVMADYEAGARYNSEKSYAAVNVYLMDYGNQLILTGKLNDVGEAIRESVKDSYRTGIELEAGITWSRLYIAANLSLSRNKIRNYTEYLPNYDGGETQLRTYTNTDISFSPSIISSGIISFQVMKNFNVELSEKYVGEQFLDNTSNAAASLDDYFVTGLLLNYELHPKFLKKLEVRCAINNLFDAKYISNGSTYSGYSGGERLADNYYYPQAGINFLAGLSVGF